MYKYFEDFGDRVEFSTFEIINNESTPEIHHVIEHEPVAACPFCGGNAAVRSRQVYVYEGMAVRCQNCGCSGRAFLIGLEHMPYPGRPNPKNLDFTDVLHRAIEVWNKRAS